MVQLSTFCDCTFFEHVKYFITETEEEIGLKTFEMQCMKLGKKLAFLSYQNT